MTTDRRSRPGRPNPWEGESHDVTAALLEAVPLAIRIVDPDTLVILEANRLEGTLTGFSRDAMIGRCERELWPDEPALRAELEAAVEAARLHGFARSYSLPYRTVSNGLIRVDATRRIVDLRGRRYEIVTSRHPAPGANAQPDATRVQVLDACGRLAAGIAHEFNNMLMVVAGGADTVLQRLRPADPVRVQIERIRRAADRAATLVRRLMAVSGKQVLQPRVVELNGLVLSIGETLRRQLGDDIELLLVPDPRPVRVNVDPEQLEHVLWSLATHARDNGVGRGRFVIEAGAGPLDGATSPGPAHVSGRYATLTVTDSRKHLDPTVQAHVFEPFFKSGEAHPGLELAAAYGVVRQSGGELRVRSEPGEGTTFTIYLPAADTLQGRPGEPARSRLTAAPAETVLLVEDETDVLEVTQELLESEGYHILTSRSPGEALRIAAQHPGAIHLLVTDVVMPGMTGHELAGRLALDRPEMKVLYMSGYAHGVPGLGAALHASAGFIQKPFGAAELARKARELLDATRAPAVPPGPPDSVETPVKVVVRFGNGAILKGTTLDFYPNKPSFHLLAAARGEAVTVTVNVADLKAVFFVRDLAGNPEYQERKEFPDGSRPPGRRIEVTFVDGEVLVGYTLGYDPARVGFFLFPADPQSNNVRVFAVAAAVRRVRYL